MTARYVVAGLADDVAFHVFDTCLQKQVGHDYKTFRGALAKAAALNKARTKREELAA